MDFGEVLSYLLQFFFLNDQIHVSLYQTIKEFFLLKANYFLMSYVVFHGIVSRTKEPRSIV